MLISVKDCIKFHNQKCILDHVSFSIEENDKVALIGVNGTGKSTLLKILVGEENYDGTILKKKGLRISYLSQEDHFREEATIGECVAQYAKDCEPFEVHSVLSKLKMDETDRKISTCSGGQRKRVSLAIALLKKSDLLILDEPTNHLDNDMIEWLEKYLMKLSSALVMVTHDRYFLERITNRIFEIDRGKIYEYEANYSAYLDLKAQREQQALANERKRNAFLRKELEWIRSNAQARSTKSKERIARFEKMSEIEKIQDVGNVEMVTVSSRLGRKIMEIENLGMSIEGKQLFSNFSYHLKRNDRIGIVGNNGCGKSTLLNLLAGKKQPSEGVVEIGETVRIGYFTQGSDDLDENEVVIDVIRKVSDNLKTDQGNMSAKAMLEMFLFDSHLQYSRVKYLSGGEKRRLFLLKVLMSAPNVLLLDEPTNDLDIQTLNVLEDYLDSFNGAVLTVSHDRYFLDRCCDYVFAFEDGVISHYVGGYSDYYDLHVQKNASKNKSLNTETKKHQAQNQIKLSSKEKKELEMMESLILHLENEIAKIDEQMALTDDFEKIRELSNQRSQLEKEIEDKNERWMTLLEKEEWVRLSIRSSL